MQQVTSYVLACWHRKSFFAYLLLPFSWLFQLLSYLRRCYYRRIQKARFKAAVIIVGNISVGGTGKTPLVGWLAEFLLNQGFKPGIVMHGYGTKERKLIEVTAASDVKEVGDEALLLAKKSGCPMVAGRNRPQAVNSLLSAFPDVDIVICDDGLQHYALDRDIEIAVIDGQRRLGNGFCLPAGPLRESPKRLKEVDFVVTNGKALKGEWQMTTALSLTIHQVVNPQNNGSLEDFVGKTVHAVAGIGHPERFFSMLRSKGINIIEHRFEDHHAFNVEDLDFSDSLPILMTEKDAVKCQRFAPLKAWFVPLVVNISEEFSNILLRRIHSGQKIARYSSLPHLQATSSL